MRCTARFAVAACTIALAAIACAGARAEEPPKFWAVTGVGSSDVLHLRDVPSADSRSLARIPPNARGLKHLGCRRNQPPMEQWARMTEAARREALTQWCRVEYKGHEGWVAGRFLKPDGGSAK
jgi:hypothetical protein